MRGCDQGERGRRWERNSLAGLAIGRSRAHRRAPAGLPPSGALPRLMCPMRHVGSSLARAARSCALLVGLAGLLVATAHADPVRLVASDARGVTIQVTVGAWTLTAPGADGRVRVNRLDGAHALGEPGRPTLPAFATTLAIPADARPTVRVIGTEGTQSRDGVRLEIAGKPVFLPGGDDRLGVQPAMEPQAAISDGPWPASSVQLAAPFAFRGRRFVQLEVRPFRYDEADQRVSSPLTLTVRVDFNRPASSPALLSEASGRDAQVDAALEGNVLNWEQGQGWRKLPGLERSRPGRTLPGNGANATTGTGLFDETQPEVRVKLAESALYKLSFDNLSTNGYPDGVAVGEVSVHRHEFAEGQSPPFVTIELPCEVEDANANGTFDSGDAVWVYVRNWAERSGASVIQRYWGDAEVVYVTSKPGGGLRVAQRAGWNNVPALTPIPSFPFKRHFERDAALFMQAVTSEADTNIGVWQWTAQSLYYNRPDTIRIETNNLDTTHAAAITVRWVGRKFETHRMWAGIKNGLNQVTTVVDSIFWYGKSAVVNTNTFPGSVLTEGNTNFFRQWGKPQELPPDPTTNYFCNAGLDWFELEYWRRYNAIQDYVRFNTADASGDVQMQVTGFTGDSLRVYDITDPDQPLRLTLVPPHVTNVAPVSFEIQDVVTPGVRREYVAACQNGVNPALGPKQPPASAYSPMTRRNLWSAVTGDYLLVVPEPFLSTVAPLVTLRSGQGLTVLEAPIESIYDEFNGGRHSGAALQRFTKYAYAHWNSRFLMMVGDGTLDPNGVMPGSGKDWIPVLPTPAPVGTGEGLEIIASDNRYGFITGSEDPISSLDTNRVVPELMVGRLTVNSAAEATTEIGKIVKYENVQPTETWRKNVLLVADDAFSGATTFGNGSTGNDYCHRFYEEYFVGLDNLMAGMIQSDTGVAGMNVTKFNLRYYLPNEHIEFNCVSGDTGRFDRGETSQHTRGLATPTLFSLLSSGQLMWNYQGHANEHLLTHEDLYLAINLFTGDEQSITNVDKPFFFTAYSCHANNFVVPGGQTGSNGPCIAERLLAMPNGRGAVASWASVTFEVVPRNTSDHINVELVRSMFVNPPRDEFLGEDDRGSRVVLGEVILSALFRYLGTVQTFSTERGLAISYTLLGDPATRISIGKPLGQVLANQVPVTSGTPMRLHTPGDTLRIDADVVSNVRIDSLALFHDTGTGDVAVSPADYTVTPPLPDTGAGNSFGGRHFKLAYRTQPAPLSQDYVIVARDRNGLVQRTEVTFQLQGLLRSGNLEINDGDQVAPSAVLSMLVLSPAPIANPTSDISLTLNGVAVAFTAAPNPGDTSGREWILSWTHTDYPIDDYVLVMGVLNGGSVTRRFRVTAGAALLGLSNLIAFPNPFDNDGTHFSFLLLGTENADLKIHVFSQSGRSIYVGVVRGLAPGYHQIAWDGHDAEGDELANGVYFYRVSATSASGKTTQQLSKLVKLRKPKHEDETTVP